MESWKCQILGAKVHFPAEPPNLDQLSKIWPRLHVAIFRTRKKSHRRCEALHHRGDMGKEEECQRGK